MPDRPTAEELFLEHLDWIKKVAGIACAKHRVWDADAEEAASWIQMKMMEDDYAIIREFRGESSLRTYLASIVARQFQDYRRQRFGRWRRSAPAERLGPPAPDLEALVYRDGYSLEQAGEKLRTAGATDLSNRQLAELLDQLPRRAPLRPVETQPDDSVLDRAPGTFHADGRVTSAEADEERRRMMDALGRATRRLDPEDQVIVRMRFMEGRTLAFVSRALGLEQKPLYRRLERVLKQLRQYLEAEGVRATDLHAILGDQEDS
jgi:RNA polymerase sigma factor (sigma-70 family)